MSAEITKHRSMKNAVTAHPPLKKTDSVSSIASVESVVLTERPVLQQTRLPHTLDADTSQNQWYSKFGSAAIKSQSLIPLPIRATDIAQMMKLANDVFSRALNWRVAVLRALLNYSSSCRLGSLFIMRPSDHLCSYF